MKKIINFGVLTLTILVAFNAFTNLTIDAKTNTENVSVKQSFVGTFRNIPLAAAPTPTSTTLNDVEVNTGKPTYDFTSYFTDDVDAAANLQYTYDDSTVDYTTVGPYTFDVTATDSNNEAVTVTMTVNVVDTTAPVATSTDLGVINISSTSPTYNFTSYFTDNYDASSNLAFAHDDSAVSYQTPGTYTFPVTVTDLNNNVATITMTIVVDGGAVIVNDTVYYEVNIQNPEPTTISSLDLSGYIKDGIDPYNSLVITFDDTAVDYKTIGMYDVQVVMTDLSGNDTTGTMKIIVRDTTPPWFTTTSDGPANTISTSVGERVNFDPVLYIQDNASGNVSYTFDDTNVDYNTQGSYIAKLTLTDASGNTATYDITIVVQGTLPQTGQANELGMVGLLLIGMLGFKFKKNFSKQ